MPETINRAPLTGLLSRELPQMQGIVLTRPTDDETVWDREAVADAMHAAVSAQDEATERQKSVPQIERILTHLSSSAVVLDVGCGYGRIAKYLLPGRELGGYIGLDSSIEMLRLFQQRYDASAMEQRTPALFVNSDIATLPLRNATVDLVVVSAVFLHNPKAIVRRSISEIARVLKPGGKLLVFSSFPRSATLTGLQGALYHALLVARGQGDRNGPVRYYSKSEMEALLREFSKVDLLGEGFTFLPKSIIGLRGIVERVFRKGLAEPINRGVAALVPRQFHPAFAVHYDVIATR